MTRPKLLQMQVIAIHKIMELHCVKGADGMATYADGWDDTRVVTEVMAVNPLPDRPITLTQVKGLRMQIFGRVRPVPTGKSNDRMRAVEAQLVRLTDWAHNVDEWMRRRGYVPPPGKAVSSPPDDKRSEHH